MVLNRVRPFKNDVSNVDILNAIRKNASSDYQRRIPDATKANIRETLENLTNARPYWNEFIDALVNRIGMEIYKSRTWTNPLAQFKIGQLEFGDTIEEIMTGLLEAKVYDPSREYLEKDIFGTERPDVDASYHKVNRQNWYKVTVNEALLQQAFNTPTGLSSFIQQLMESPLTSDNYDEFLLTTSLFADYHSNGGFFNVQVPDLRNIDSDSADARFALRRMREMAGTLPFLSSHYNAAGMPAFANQEDLVLLTTPQALSAIDVDALAGAFNIEKADMPGRTIVIPQEHFGITGAQAIMTTKDFFVIADQLFRTESQWNPVGLHNNYFLHHWQVISYSRFVPAVLFSTEPSTVIEIDSPPVTSVQTPTAVDTDFEAVTSVVRGEKFGIDSMAITTPPDGVNDQVLFSVTGANSDRTYITQNGTLYVGADETSTELVVTATSGWIDPDGDGAPFTASVTLPVTGDILVLWPNPHVDAEDPVTGATGATAGTPGTWTPADSSPAANITELRAEVTASPATAWTTGQYVSLDNGKDAYWDGSDWRYGIAP